MLAVLKVEMGEGTKSAGTGVKVLFENLEHEVECKERAASKIRRCTRDLNKCNLKISQIKEDYAQRAAAMTKKLNDAIQYVDDALPGTREQNRRRSLMRLVEAEQKKMQDDHADLGIDMGVERRKREAALKNVEEEHAVHEAAEAKFRIDLKLAQEGFIEEHKGLIMQAFRIFDEDGSGSLDYDEVRRVVDGLGQLPEDPEEAEEEFDRMCKLCDKDGDGEIDAAEFVELIIESLPRLVPAGVYEKEQAEADAAFEVLKEAKAKLREAKKGDSLGVDDLLVEMCMQDVAEAQRNYDKEKAEADEAKARKDAKDKKAQDTRVTDEEQAFAQQNDLVGLNGLASAASKVGHESQIHALTNLSKEEQNRIAKQLNDEGRWHDF